MRTEIVAVKERKKCKIGYSAMVSWVLLLSDLKLVVKGDTEDKSVSFSISIVACNLRFSYAQIC